MSAPATDIANYLEISGIGTVGTDIFIDKMPEEGNRPLTPTMTVYNTGGFDPAVNFHRKHYQPTVQIVIAGKPGDYVATETKALAIQEKMTDPVSFAAAPFDYYGSYQQGDTVFLGYDENNRPEFSLNFRLFRRRDH